MEESNEERYRAMGIEQWRLEKNPNRPERKYVRVGDSGEFRELPPELPKKIYRELHMGDLLYLIKNGELPLSHFTGSHDSRVSGGSVGTFWFGKPMVFNKNWYDALVMTEPKKWTEEPSFVQESNMRYKTNNFDPTEAMWHPDQGREYVAEYHVGNRVKREWLHIFLNPDKKKKIESLTLMLRYLNKKASLEDLKKSDKYASFGLTSGSKTDAEFENFIENQIIGFLLDIGHKRNTLQRLYPDLIIDPNDNFDAKKKFVRNMMSDSKFLEELLQLLEQLNSLPTVKQKFLSDLNDQSGAEELFIDEK